MPKSKRKTIYVQLSEDTYAAFIEAANKAGASSLKEFAGQLLERALLSNEEINPAKRTILEMRRRQEERENALRTIAKEYRRAIEGDNPDMTEELVNLAKEFDITREELDAVISVGIGSGPTTTEVERATAWLAQYLSKKRIAPVREVWAEADKVGISRWAVKTAASQSPTIKSVKTGSYWSLVMERN